MIRVSAAALLCACRLAVDLGEPGDTSDLHLIATPTNIGFMDPRDVKLRATPSGDLLVCSDHECLSVPQKQRTQVTERIEDFAIPEFGKVLVASAAGLSLCTLGTATCETARADMLPVGLHEGTPVFGLAPAANGDFLFVTSNGAGIWDSTERRASIYQTIEADAPIIGTTRAGAWLRLSREPFVCQLDGATCASTVALSSPVSQVVQLSEGGLAFATMGGGLVLSDGSSQTLATDLPSQHVLDAIEWQGAVWLATDQGLARFDPGTHRTDIPRPQGLGGLAHARVLALGVLSDGSLAVFGGMPAQLYRVRMAAR